MACSDFQEKKNVNNLKLEIRVNGNYWKYLDRPNVLLEREDSIAYDSISNQTSCFFDSLRNKKTILSIFSILAADFEKIVDLQKDTVITFDTTEYAKFAVGNAKDLLKSETKMADTFYIGQKVTACFGGSTEKIKFTKMGTEYEVDYRRNNDTGLNAKFLISDLIFNKAFKQFLVGCKKIMSDNFNGENILHFSTTQFNTYIRNGNVIYELPDFYDWQGYNVFKKGIGLDVIEK
jgi:hypothetical protein